MGIDQWYGSSNQKSGDSWWNVPVSSPADNWSSVAADLTRDQITSMMKTAQSSFSQLARGNPYHNLTACALQLDAVDPKLTGAERSAAKYLLDNYSWIEGVPPPKANCSRPINSVNNFDNQHGVSENQLHDLELIASNNDREVSSSDVTRILKSVGEIAVVAGAAGRLFGVYGAVVAGVALGAIMVLSEGYHHYERSQWREHLPTK
jgi:hypothetical protein